MLIRRSHPKRKNYAKNDVEARAYSNKGVVLAGCATLRVAKYTCVSQMRFAEPCGP